MLQGQDSAFDGDEMSEMPLRLAEVYAGDRNTL